jgi:hypothetical protein
VKAYWSSESTLSLTTPVGVQGDQRRVVLGDDVREEGERARRRHRRRCRTGTTRRRS